MATGQLKRATPKPLDHSTGTAGRWESADGRFLIYRPVKADFSGRGKGWFIAVAHGADNRAELEKLLQEVGLHWSCGASFPTRRAALNAVQQVAYP